ncbi:MAG: carbohydrate kinase family protein [Pyrinomonadaceae bacterium]
MLFPFKLPDTNDFDVVGFGTNSVDHLISVAEYPEFNSKTEIIDHFQAAGGEVASTLVGVTRLGFKTTYVGRFGGDPAGNLGLRSLVAAGVDITYAETIEKAKTQIAFILIDEKSGERTILWQRDANLGYSALDAPVGAATRGRVLHLTPHDTAASIEMARAARKAGVIVTIDVDNLFAGLEELLPLVDVCIASSDFAERLVGIADKKTSLREVSVRYGCPVTGVTLGNRGSLFYCRENFIETSGFDVPGGCVDTTGAGDAFRTGFLFGMLTGRSIEECAAAANAVAALKCRSIGARTSLPNLSDLMKFLNNVDK